MDNSEKILALIYECIDELNAQLPEDQRLQKKSDTLLSDKESSLDSLGLVNLIVITEQKIQETFGTHVVLADESSLSQESSPFVSIASMTNYIQTLLQE